MPNHRRSVVVSVLSLAAPLLAAVFFLPATPAYAQATLTGISSSGPLVGLSGQQASITFTFTPPQSQPTSFNASASCCFDLSPSLITVPAGSTSGSFTITAGTASLTDVSKDVTITVSGGGSSVSVSTTVAETPILAGFSVSPSTIIGGSTQQAQGTISLVTSAVASFGVGISASPAIPGGLTWTGNGVSANGITVPAGVSTFSFTIFAQSAVPSAESTTVSVGFGASSNFYGSGVTVEPNTPTLTLSKNSIIGNSQDTVTGTVSLAAAVPNGLGIGLTQSAPGGLNLPAGASIPAGQSSVTFSFTAGSPASAVSVTVTADTGTLTASASLTIYPNTDPSLPCPPGNCEAQAAQPINLTNGNVWVTQHDYSLPGLGGGLSLDRTWNSLWATFRGSQPAAGMFGDSWRGTYEERLASSGSSFIQYFRSNGDAWWFQANGPSYQLTNPPNQRATLVYDGTAMQYTLTFADGTKRVFSGTSGYLTALTDRNNNQVSITRDSSNRITQVTDAASRTLSFAYANASFPLLATSASDATGSVATYTYDSSQRLTNVAYPDASQLNFAYDGNNLLTGVTDAQSKVIESHTYDSSRRGLTSQQANGMDAVTVSYPSAGTTTLTDSLGNSTTYSYTNIGLSHFISVVSGPTCSTCGAGNTSSFAYDSSGNRASSTDANGNATSFTYDSMGNVLTRSNVVSGSTLTWTYTYNSFGEALTAQDPLGFVTTNTYDANGNLLTSTTPSPDGVKPGSATTFTYDTKGELLTVTDPLNNKTTIAYYSTGLINTITDVQNNTTTFTYDARGNRLTAKDALNNTTQFSYDAMNRLKKITYADTTTTQFAYDTRGRRISVTDANNKVTTYGYDDADRLSSVKDAANNTTTYGYDTENNLTSIKDANLHTTSFSYNANRWASKTTFPSGALETYGYDLAGNLTSKTDRKNQTITYTYDQLNRLTKKSYPDSTAVNYTYDNGSRLTQVSDPTGTYSFTFDNMGRLTGTTTSYSFLTGRNFTTGYGYDPGSNRTGFTDPEGGATAYVYDTLNRPQTLTPPAAFASTGNFGFSYDALSRRTQLTRPNSVTTTYGYDTLSRLLNVTHKKGATTLDGAAYTVDAAGNRLSRTPLPSGTGTNFTYDPIYELLTSKQGKTTTESYTYDSVGNRLTSLSFSSYTYNSSNELTAAGGNTTYTYDNNGNPLSKVVSGHGGGTTTFAWDFENRLASVTLPGSGGTVSFKYDPFGRRIYKSSSSGSSIYAYDGDNLVEETNSSGGVVARYAQGLNIDDPLAMLRSATVSFYQADGLGSVTSLSNSAGALAQTYAYDSFGKQTSSSGSLTNPFQYTARESDTETGLYYYRARYYDPTGGRFLNEDPIRSRGGINFYRYVSNNPAFSKDPYGLAAECPLPDCKTLSLNNAASFWDDSFATPEQVDAFFQSTNAPASWDGYDAAAAFIAQGINPGLAVGIVGGETSFGNNGLSARNVRDPFSSGGTSFAGSLSRAVGAVVKLENHTYTDDTPVTALFNGMNDLASSIPGSGQAYSTTDRDRYPNFIDSWFQKLARFLGKCK